MRYRRTKNRTEFFSTDQKLILKLLEKSGISIDICFVKDSPSGCTHLNRRLSNIEIQKFSVWAEIETKKMFNKIHIGDIVKGYTGDPISGFGVRFF